MVRSTASICPPMTSRVASGPPRYGVWINWMAARLLQQLERQMAHAARWRRAARNLARIGARIRQEFVERLRGKILPHRHHLRKARGQRDRNEGGPIVERDILDQRAVAQVVVAVPQARVAVGRGLHDGRRGDDRVAAGLVLDDDGLAQRLRCLVGHRAGDGVAAAARRERNHEANGTRWPTGLRMHRADRPQRHQSELQQRAPAARAHHVGLLSFEHHESE